MLSAKVPGGQGVQPPLAPGVGEYVPTLQGMQLGARGWRYIPGGQEAQELTGPLGGRRVVVKGEVMVVQWGPGRGGGGQQIRV